jgi:hypothetical protein
MIVKTLCIQPSPNTHHIQWNHLPHVQCKMVIQLSPLTSQTLTHPARHNPINTKKLKKHTPYFCSNPQCRNKWLIDSPQCLHKQHRSSTIIFLLHKLSKINIFPRATIHAKNATLRGSSTFQMLFQRQADYNGVDN